MKFKNLQEQWAFNVDWLLIRAKIYEEKHEAD